MGNIDLYLRTRFLAVLNFCLLLSFFSCSSERENHYVFSGPYEQSFWNKNIAYVLRKNRIDIDTLKFDQFGNITEEQSSGRSYVRRLFDKNHRVIRELNVMDPENVLVSYDSGVNWIIQNRIGVRGLKWGMDSLEIDLLRSTKSICVFDDEKRIKTLFSVNDEEVKEYSFEDNGLMEEVVVSMQGKQYRKRYTHFYYQNNLIQRIEEFHLEHSEPDIIYFFNSGRLDSLHEFTKERIPILTTFQYVYN